MTQLDRLDLTRYYAKTNPHLYIRHDPEDQVFSFATFAELLSTIENPSMQWYEQVSSTELKLPGAGHLFGPELETRHFCQPPPPSEKLHFEFDLDSETEYSYRHLARLLKRPGHYVWLDSNGLQLYSTLEGLSVKLSALNLEETPGAYFINDGEDVIEVISVEDETSTLVATLAGDFSGEVRERLQMIVNAN